MKAEVLSLNINDPGEVYFIRERDVITGELSPYTKIGLVGARKGSGASAVSAEDQEVEDSEAEVSEDDFDGGTSDDMDESGSIDEFILKNSLKRLNEHQTGNASKLVLASGGFPVVHSNAVGAIEKALHERYAPLRVRGEWFLLSDAQRNEAVELAQQLAAEVEAQRQIFETASQLASVDSTDEVLKADSELLDFNEEFKVVELQVKDLARRATEIENQIRNATLSVMELDGVACWTQRKSSKKFDWKAAAAEVPDEQDNFFAPKRAQTLRPIKAHKSDLPSIKEDKAPYDGGKLGLLKIADREEGIESLHQEYLQILSRLNELQWKRTFCRAFLKSKFGDAKEIDGVAKWERKTEVVFNRFLVKPYLEATNRLDLIKKHTTETPESFSFSVLPMRPYPLR